MPSPDAQKPTTTNYELNFYLLQEEFAGKHSGNQYED
jgi:hypothetical protein